MADTVSQAAADSVHQGRETASDISERTKTPQTGLSGKNIVLLSDGTGNSAGKLNQTNVWRLYQALDLTNGNKQIAMYDDGVGTSGVKALKLLGGAFGWGLSRNVRDLYRFLCQHYAKGDRIYIFGFSRGAFTARVLAGLIGKCGILDPGKEICRSTLPGRKRKGIPLSTDEGRGIGVKLAYQSYRRRYRAPVATLVRTIRDIVRKITGQPEILEPDEFRRRYSRDDSRSIEFIGVWDTVDAVGLPIDELSIMVDRIFYPHRFPDRNLAQHVDRACHAIAVDDERNTFHPVLWNENGTQNTERITQVWFAGMHANVGGGYPDDGLAHVSLSWMIGQAAGKGGAGLIFEKQKVDEIARRSQPLSKMHNSRAGPALYYRYKPRLIASLCHDRSAGIEIDEPKVHESVFERIRYNTAGYSPPGVPTRYKLVDAAGKVSSVNPDRYETEADREGRVGFLDRAQSHIFWLRVNYFATLVVTLGLVLLPHWRPPVPGRELDGYPEYLGDAFAAVSPFLPGFLDYWTDGWSQSPGPFLVLLAIYVALLAHASWVKTNTRRLAEVGWWHVKAGQGPKPPISNPGPFEWLATRLRKSKFARALYGWSTRSALPVIALALSCLFVLGAVYRVAFHQPTVSAGACNKWMYEQTKNKQSDAPGGQLDAGREIDFDRPFDFDTGTPCLDTGLKLVAGEKYTITVEVKKPWLDLAEPAGPRGLSDDLRRLDPMFLVGVPARRHLRLPWFALTAEVDRDSGDVFPVPVSDTDKSITFRPETTGSLHLYVNDGISHPGFNAFICSFGVHLPNCEPDRVDRWNAYYLNNSGTATITVRAGDQVASKT